MPRWIRWLWARYRQPVDTPRESDVPTDPTVAQSRPPRRGKDTGDSGGSETFVGRLSDDFSSEDRSGAEQRTFDRDDRDDRG